MKFGAPILTSELSGSLGGITASSARGGVGYFRTRTTPSNPRTFTQTTVRNILAGLAAAWVSTLTDAQRVAWAALAPPNQSGIDVYVAANSVLLQGTGSRVDDAPETLSAVFNPPATWVINSDASSNMGALTATDAYNATAGGVLAVYASGLQRTSRLSRQFPYRFLTFKKRAGAAITAGDMNTLVEAALVARFGPNLEVTGERVIYMKLVAVDTLGRTSTPVEYRISITNV